MKAFARSCGVALLLLIAGCAQTVVVRAPSLLPARVPLQVFPAIWVAGPASGDEGYVLDRLAAQLAEDRRREVRRVELEQLEPARLAHQIRPLTAVIRITLQQSHEQQQQSDMLPVQSCGMFGCVTTFQSYVQVVDVRSADATLYLHDGPTAQVLQTMRFGAKASDLESDRPQELALERLVQQLLAGTDVMRIREEYRLYSSRVKSAERGVDLLVHGKWVEGRAQLEQAARELGGRDKETQARVWYDLGVARLLAPGNNGLSDDALAAAERALRWAERVLPSEQNRQALSHVAELRKRQQVLIEQKRAQELNYARAALKGG